MCCARRKRYRFCDVFDFEISQDEIENHRKNQRRRRGNNNKSSTKSMILVPSIDVKLQTLLAVVRRTGGLGRTKFNLENKALYYFLISSYGK